MIGIIRGWWYFVTRYCMGDKKHREMVDSRLNICATCPDKRGAFCGNCGCYLKAKASDTHEHCPILKW